MPSVSPKSHGERIQVELFSKISEPGSIGSPLTRTQRDCFGTADLLRRPTRQLDLSSRTRAGFPVREPTTAASSFGVGHADDEGSFDVPKGAKRPLRLWCHIYLHMQVKGFELVPMMIGRGGCNMRKIFEATGAKIRIRGRGSGHFEIDGKREAPTPLMVAVTTDKLDHGSFKAAIEMTLVELRAVEQRFLTFCEKQNYTHEGPCFSIGVMPQGVENVLGDVFEGVPHTGPKQCR